MPIQTTQLNMARVDPVLIFSDAIKSIISTNRLIDNRPKQLIN